MPPRLTGKSKPPKGENMNVRLPIRHRFALELLAQKRGVSITTIVIDALDAYLRAPTNGLVQESKGREAVYVPDKVWDPVEPDRLLHIATQFPEYLSDDQHYLWKIIQKEPRFYSKEIGPNYHEVRTHWQWIQDEAVKLKQQFGGRKNG